MWHNQPHTKQNTSTEILQTYLCKVKFFPTSMTPSSLDIGSSSSSSVTIYKGINGKVGDGWYSEVVWKSTFGDGEGVIADKSRELLLMDGICVGLIVEIYM